MYQNDTNEYGCPLRDQTGSVAVQNFDAIIALLAPELRAAFEAERAALQDELDRYLAAGTSTARDSANTSVSRSPGPIARVEPPSGTHVLFARFEQLLEKLSRLRLRNLIDSLLPPIAAQQ